MGKDREHVRLHAMDALRGEMLVNLITLALRSMILTHMRSSGLFKKYSVKKTSLEFDKLIKIILQNSLEITADITETERHPGIIFVKPEHVPTFLMN